MAVRPDIILQLFVRHSGLYSRKVFSALYLKAGFAVFKAVLSVSGEISVVVFKTFRNFFDKYHISVSCRVARIYKILRHVAQRLPRSKQIDKQAAVAFGDGLHSLSERFKAFVHSL